MNWIKQNTFLAGFFAILLVGVGALGFLVFKASAAHTDAEDRYTTASAELTRLQGLKLSPNQKNLEFLVGQKKEFTVAVSSFQATLAKMNAPGEEMTPEKFSDKVNALKTMVTEKSVGITKFQDKDKAMGFEGYANVPPRKEAVLALSQELKAAEWIAQQILNAQITEVKEIRRDPLPEESGRPAPGPGGGGPGGGGRGGAGPGGGGGGGGADGRMTKRVIELDFQCRQEALGKFLNTFLAPTTPYFFIVRSISITNQKQTGPEKLADANAVQPVAVVGKPEAVTTYIVGEEELDVKMRIEIVNFAEPASTTTPPK